MSDIPDRLKGFTLQGLKDNPTARSNWQREHERIKRMRYTLKGSASFTEMFNRLSGDYPTPEPITEDVECIIVESKPKEQLLLPPHDHNTDPA